MSKSATVFINYLASQYVFCDLPKHMSLGVLLIRARYSANENTVNANKKTIAPADVFKALDDIEFSFLKEPLEAEFASTW